MSATRKSINKQQSIGIVGGGILGKAVARGFMEHAEIKVYDIEPDRATHELEEVATCDFVFICLPTPARPDGKCNTEAIDSFLDQAALAKWWTTESCYVIRSTVPVGYTQSQATDKRPIMHSPEFLTARCAVTDFQLPARNIIGTTTHIMAEQLDSLVSLYEARFPGVPVQVMRSDESELVKLACNSFFAAKVTMFNVFYDLAQARGLNWDRVRAGILSDGRIAHSHTQVPGPDGFRGAGGACLIPETPISTPSGWAAIEDLSVGDVVIDHYGETKITGFSVRSVPKIVTVRARGREVSGSGDHIHLCASGGMISQKLLGQFQAGEFIVIPRPTLPAMESEMEMPPARPFVKSWPESVKISTDLAWAIGLWLADGYSGVYPDGKGRQNHVVAWTLGESKEQQSIRLTEVLAQYGLIANRKFRISQGTYGESRIWLTRVRATWFYYLLDVLGLHADGLTKRAPVWPGEHAKALIGGWLDGDGSYSGGTISGHSESRDMIRDFDRMLLGLGICATAGDGRELRISTRDAVAEVCGWTTRHVFEESRYASDHSYASPTLREHPLGWIAQVQDVTTTFGEQQVIAIETESGHYIANGHLTHNCLPKDLADLWHCCISEGVDASILAEVLERNAVSREGDKALAEINLYP